MVKAFIRKIENFKCAHCGADVVGNGYTNHCPACLWSRDVDIAPGDRASTCGGLMRPVFVSVQKDDYIITHQCETCGKIRRQKSSPEDNVDVIVRISANPDFIFGKK
jgi:endogenous inhibitor of DNA gyrase (YacG/DUF329 family)